MTLMGPSWQWSPIRGGVVFELTGTGEQDPGSPLPADGPGVAGDESTTPTPPPVARLVSSGFTDAIYAADYSHDKQSASHGEFAGPASGSATCSASPRTRRTAAMLRPSASKRAPARSALASQPAASEAVGNQRRVRARLRKRCDVQAAVAAICLQFEFELYCQTCA